MHAYSYSVAPISFYALESSFLQIRCYEKQNTCILFFGMKQPNASPFVKAASSSSELQDESFMSKYQAKRNSIVNRGCERSKHIEVKTE